MRNAEWGCRARSKREFIARMGVVEEEADESLYWLETMADAGVARAEHVSELRHEAGQLVAIMVSSIRTARGGRAPVPHSTFHIPH